MAEATIGAYGGMSRLPYFLWNVGVQMIAAFVMALLAPLGFAKLAVALGGACFLSGWLYVAALRFRNQGASPWWAVGLLVPLLNFYVVLRAFAYPPGYAQHRTFDATARWIVGLSLGLLVLTLAVLLFVPMFAAVVTP